MAEVVGFREEIVILMPYTNIRDISSGCLVEGLGKPLEIKVGMNLIGKVLDSMGNPMDNSQLPRGLSTVRTEQDPPNALTRPPINEKLAVGVKAIDGMLTVGNGQRVGIFRRFRCWEKYIAWDDCPKYDSRFERYCANRRTWS